MKLTENIHKTINAAGEPLRWCEHEIANYIEPLVKNYFDKENSETGLNYYMSILRNAINDKWRVSCHYRTSPGGFETQIILQPMLNFNPTELNPYKMYFGTYSVTGFKIPVDIDAYYDSYLAKKKGILISVARYIIDEEYIEGDPDSIPLTEEDAQTAFRDWLEGIYMIEEASKVVQDLFVRTGSPFSGKFDVEELGGGLPLSLAPEEGFNPVAPIVIGFRGR